MLEYSRRLKKVLYQLRTVIGHDIWTSGGESYRRLQNLHKEALHDGDPSPNILVTKSRRMRWKEPQTRTGAKGNGYNIFLGKYQVKRLLARYRCK
jgi:hypothetical protein